MDRLSDQLLNHDSYLGRVRVTISSGNVVRVDSSQDQAALLAPNEVAIRSVDILVREKALRRDLAKVFPQKHFWDKPLDRVHSTIEDLNADQKALGNATLSGQKLASAESLFRDVENLTMQAAAQEHFEVEVNRDIVTGFKVEVHIVPPKARVRYMPLLAYLICKRVADCPDSAVQWMDLTEGSTSMIGKYRYRAEWPAASSRTLEGTFTIREDKVLTFTPLS